MAYSNLWLAQLQFFTSLAFMVLFLALELGLAWVLLYFRWRARGTARVAWLTAYRFWVRVFAFAYILAFAAVIPVLLQTGSLWPHLLSRIGDVAGPLVAAGMITAFVLKSCFLGAMLFGQRRVSEGLHIFFVFMVAIGATLAMYWLLCLLAWMHTPAGATLINERYVVDDWAQILMSPALPSYAGLFLSAALLLTSFVMMAVGAMQAQRRPVDEAGRIAFKTALTVSLPALGLQVISLFGASRMATRYQPAMVATTLGQELERYAGMAPPRAFTFWSFRVALLMGACMAIVALWTVLRRRQHHYDAGVMSPAWRVLFIVMGLGAVVLFVAGMGGILAGALPYVVSGTVTLIEVAGESLPDRATLATSFLVQGIMYLMLLMGFIRLLRHMSRYGVVPVARHRGRA